MSRIEIVKRRIAKIKAGGYKKEKAYRKTVKGFLVGTYNNMQGRVRGNTKKKDHLYKGLDILDRESFYSFSIKNEDFIDLFIQWILSAYETKFTPSIDRIDPSNGYTIENIRWLTLSENSKLGAKVRWRSR